MSEYDRAVLLAAIHIGIGLGALLKAWLPERVPLDRYTFGFWFGFLWVLTLT